MLGQRRRRWLNINAASIGECIVQTVTLNVNLRLNSFVKLKNGYT